MKSILPFTIAMVAWVSREVSVTEASCVFGYQGSIFLSYEHHALFGHSFLNQSGTVRIKCAMLCLRSSRCLSFNHDDTSGICQLNDARKEDFLESYKQDDGFSYFGGSNEAKPLTEEPTVTTKTEQETTLLQATATERVITGPSALSTESSKVTSPKTVDTEGPTVNCPPDVFGLTNDSNARTSVQWKYMYANDDVDKFITPDKITCMDDDEGRTVTSGASFKVGTTTVTCMTSDAAGNPGNCTFLVTVTVCNITRLGMESGDIADKQITAKSVWNNDTANYGPALARFNSHGSWCGEQGTNPWIQVDLDHTVDIYGLIIQGRYGTNQHVTSFMLKYSNDGSSWMNTHDAGKQMRLYQSARISNHHDVVVSVETTTQKMIQSRYIRIEPMTQKNQRCLRFELLGCN